VRLLERARSGALQVGVAAVVLTGALSAVLLLLGGYDPLATARAALAGAFGSADALLSITLVRAIPLMLTGLAVAFAFRAGVWNIGAEGQLLVGAIAAVWMGLAAEALPPWLLTPAVLLAAALAGAFWALVPALMKVRLGVGEVITTLLMSFVGIYLVGWVVQGPLQEPRGVFPQSEAIAAGARLPALVPGTRLHVGLVLAVAAAVALGWIFRSTRLGFRMRAVGASVGAARIAGNIDTDRVVLVSFLGSGALAGLAGGVQIAGVTFALYEGFSPGWGYTAIAVALLAALDPVWVLATALLFGALEAGAAAAQRDAGVPAVWAIAVQALVILTVLALDVVRRRARAEGAGV
jgi:simple sugar transport system permease protein